MDKWELLIVFLLGLFIGWLLTSQQKPTRQNKETSTQYTKLEDGFRVLEKTTYD